MRAIYIARYSADGDKKIAITSVSMPITKRKDIKNEFKTITREPVSFSDITYGNVKTSYNFCKLFMKMLDMTSTTFYSNAFFRSMYCSMVFSAATSEYIKHKKEPVRVYIPFDKDKTCLKSLNIMAAARGLNMEFEEIKFEESCFQQLASLLSGCIYYRRDDEKYLEALGVTPQAQLTAYVYSAKKDKGKLDIWDHIPKSKKKKFLR